ncbi:MAG: hypothetical protein U1E10_15410 [Bdellovibrionales bacterium]|nr:hypothetical protein [Bdellovibrionales bacterium]
MKSSFSNNAIRIILLTLVSVVILVQYQNCSWTEGFGTSSSTSSKMDGGNGYDGKIAQYVVWDETGICPDKILERITVENAGTPQQTSFFTRRNCEDIVPEVVALDGFAFMDHNPNNIVGADRPFDLFVTDGFDDRTTILCRGEADKKSRDLHVFADVKISPSGLQTGAGTIPTISPASSVRGKAFLGVYDLNTGSLVSQKEGDNIPLNRNPADACPKDGCDPGFEYFLSETSSDRNWRLEVPLLSGQLGTIRIDMENGETVSAKIPCFRK